MIGWSTIGFRACLYVSCVFVGIGCSPDHVAFLYVDLEESGYSETGRKQPEENGYEGISLPEYEVKFGGETLTIIDDGFSATVPGLRVSKKQNGVTLKIIRDSSELTNIDESSDYPKITTNLGASGSSKPTLINELSRYSGEIIFLTARKGDPVSVEVKLSSSADRLLIKGTVKVAGSIEVWDLL